MPIQVAIERDWLDWLSACSALISALSAVIVPLVVAGFAAWIGVRQNRTDRNRLRLELFERRMAIYALLERAGIEVTRNQRVDRDTYEQMLRVVPQSRFLFGPQLEEFCLSTLKRCGRLNFLTPVVDKALGAPDRQAWIEEKSLIANELVADLAPDALAARFAPELRIEAK